MDTSWGADDDMLALSQDSDVLTDNSASDAGVNSDAEELTDRVDHEGDLHRELTGWGDDQGLGLITGRVDALECTDGECACFTSSRLSLNANTFCEFRSKNDEIGQSIKDEIPESWNQNLN